MQTARWTVRGATESKTASIQAFHTRDLFIFSMEDGSKWIHIARQKTKAECHIKLLDILLNGKTQLLEIIITNLAIAIYHISI